MTEDIANYRNRCESLAQFACDKFGCLEFYAKTDDLKYQMEQMNSALGLVYANTHNMMTRLLEAVLEDNERVDNPQRSRSASA